MQALWKEGEETRRELEEWTCKIHEEINKMRMGLEGMAANYNKANERTEDAMRRIQEQARKERGQGVAEY